MQRRCGVRRRFTRLLAVGRGGADLISVLPDDVLLLVLTRLSCATAAARTGILSRRWRGLWARLCQIVFSDVPFRSLEAVLGRFPLPPPAVSLIHIRIPSTQLRGRVHWADAASATSLLRAAPRLEPEEFVFQLPRDLINPTLPVELPCFHRATSIVLDLRSVIRRLPAGVEFLALKTMSLSHCRADIERLLSCCPRLPRIRLIGVYFEKCEVRVNSASLQELFGLTGVDVSLVVGTSVLPFLSN